MYASSRPSRTRLASTRQLDPSDHALRRGFLISGRAVDLPGKEEPANALGLERGSQLSRLDEIVFNCVSGSKDCCVFEARKRTNQLLLHIPRQRHREAVDVDLVDVQPLQARGRSGAAPIGESHDLVFERRAISRTDALNLAVVQRGCADVAANEIADAIVRVEQPAAI